MKHKRLMCNAVLSLLLVGGITGTTPANAEGPTTPNSAVSTTIERSCVHHKFSGLSAGPYSKVSPETIEVSRPAQVKPNEVFNVVITPGELATGIANSGRQSYDIALPTNATLLSAQVLGTGTNFNGSALPTIARVDGSRKTSASGNFLRLWGGQSAGPGDAGTSSTSTARNVWNAGLVADASKTYRFPPVHMRFRAPASGAQNITYGLAGAGSGGSESDASKNSLTFAEQYSITTTLVYCGATANAATLAQTQVIGGTAWRASSTTEITSLPEEAESGQTISVSARVNAPDADQGQLAGTTMEFSLGDGTSLGTATVNGSGMATKSISLPPLAPGQSSTNHQITAKFLGSTYIDPSSSVTRNVQVIDKVWLQAPRTPSIEIVETPQGANKNVSISSVVSGGSLPSNLRVQLFKNDEAFGPPKSASGALNWSDSVLQVKNDTFAVYQVKVIELFEGNYRYFGQSVERPVLVLGSAPESGLEPGYTWTSADLINQSFADPFGFWRALQTGSNSFS